VVDKRMQCVRTRPRLQLSCEPGWRQLTVLTKARGTRGRHKANAKSVLVALAKPALPRRFRDDRSYFATIVPTSAFQRVAEPGSLDVRPCFDTSVSAMAAHVAPRTRYVSELKAIDSLGGVTEAPNHHARRVF